MSLKNVISNDSPTILINKPVSTGELQTRTLRAPDYEKEANTFRELSKILKYTPDGMMDALAEHAMLICGAQSAGISIAEVIDGEEVFRWKATAGHIKPLLFETMPKDFSPCGFVLECNRTQLMKDPVRYYHYGDHLGLGVHEILLVPFYKGEKAIGTLWVISYVEGRIFDLEDVRLIESIATFISAFSTILSLANNSEQINDRISAQNAEIVAKKAIEKLEREKELREKFVSTLTHDLRSPMTAAKMTSQLVFRKNPESALIQNQMSKVVANIDRADRMIQNLLDANHIQSGEKLKLCMEELNIGQVILECMMDLNTVYGERFVVSVLDDVTGFWNLDSLKRIIDNLASNAVKYGTMEDDIKIIAKREYNFLFISVHNEGTPISLPDQETIFNAFKRTNSAVLGSQKGWGLGLTLVLGMVEAHGGKVVVESLEASGTTFTIVLPIDASAYGSMQ